MQRILVTGSEGLVGSGIIPALEQAGAEIHRLDIRCRPGLSTHGDVCELEDVKRAVEGCTGIIHLAAVSRVVWGQKNPELCWKTNFEGTQNVLNAAAQSPTTQWVLLASSREVYGEPEKCPVAEDAPLRPVNIYGRAKLAAERAVLQARAAGILTAICRLSNVYGTTNDHCDRVVPAFARAAVDGTRLRVDGRDHTFDFTHIDDTVRGILAICAALELGEELPPIHLLTGQPTTLGELASMAVEAGGGVSAFYEAPPRNFDVARFWGDPSRANELLGWRADVTIQNGIRRLVNDFAAKLQSPSVKKETA